MTRFREKFKTVDCGTKKAPFNSFGESKSFSQTKISSLFCVCAKLYKSNERIQIETHYIEMGKQRDGRTDPRTDKRTGTPSGKAESLTMKNMWFSHVIQLT